MDLLEKYSLEINELKRNKFVDAIILFGSYSTNNIKPLSDLDICVILKKEASKEIKNEILSYGTDDFDISVFEDLPLSLQYKILKTGKILYSKKDLSNLKIKITNKWFDFRPILNRLYESRGYLKNKI